MAQRPWTKLDRGQAQDVLQHLAERRDAVVFSKEYTEVSYYTLPFYTHYHLYRLINYATMPTFTMTYLSNGQEYIRLDGTANPIYTVNEKDPITLNEMNVIPYLEFFFSNVQGSEGDVFLMTDQRKMPPGMRSLSPVLQKSIADKFKTLAVSSAAPDLKVSGTLYYGGSLIATTIIVDPSGKITFQDQSVLTSGMYVPETPYESRRAWFDEG